MSGNFFDQFSFWDTADPTNGFVAYQSQSNSQAQNLISGGTGGAASFGVDNTTQTPNGRPSVRITSNKSYQAGSLVVLDVAHMPGGICGTWPAFWTVGPNWPNQGEIDIIEGVNDQQQNDMTLHTGPGCTISNNGGMSGSLVSSSCVSGSGNNQGCQIATQNTATYGSNFNSNGGGVYAMEWTASAISVYFFPRGSIPSDALGSSPNPSSWGQPLAKFSGGCDMSTAFTNQQIVFDTTFCGDWAGQVWSGSTCASSTGSSTCNDFVANNPSAFDEAYWTVNGLKVYQSSGGSSPAPSSAPAGSSPAPSSSPAPQPSTSAWGGPQGPSQSAASTTSVSAWGGPQGPSSAAPAPSAPQTSVSAWGGPQGPSHSSFVTVPSAAPASSGAPSAAPVPSGAPSGAPSAAPAPSGAPSSAPAPSGAPSGAPAPSSAPTTHSVANWSGQPGWPASKTSSGAPTWQSGWTEVQNSDGSYNVGHPVKKGGKRDASPDVKRIHSRHLARHRRRHGGGFL